MVEVKWLRRLYITRMLNLYAINHFWFDYVVNNTCGRSESDR